MKYAGVKGKLHKVEDKAAGKVHFLDGEGNRIRTVDITPEPTKGDKKSTDIINFEKYQTLLREDPEQAKIFAKQIGITPTGKDTRTEAIKNFEYGVKNPDFALQQKEKWQKK